jgi:outer membrane protein
MEFPVYQGGSVSSQAQKAHYQYQQAGDELQKAYRNIIRQTRQSYLQIISNLGNIRANKQAIKAARSALKSSKAAYKAGTRTFVDVLDRQSEFYQAKRNYAEARYNFLIATLSLKNAAGMLSFDDIRQINSWLHKAFNVEAKVLPKVRNTGQQ